MPGTNSIARTIADANQIGVELMITDAKTAHTLLDTAEGTGNPEAKSRRIHEALTAYRTIVSFLQRLSPSVEQMQVLHKEMDALRTRLRSEGAPVD